MAKKKITPDTTDTIPDRKQLYKLRIKLMGTHIPIWRDVVVPSDVVLANLHIIILMAMGWSGEHLAQFTINKQDFPLSSQEMLSPPDIRTFNNKHKKDNSPFVPLNYVLGSAKKFQYVYDFGDSWYHEITVKSVTARDKFPYVPYCLASEGACPPEDIGGVRGYYQMCEALKIPRNPRYAQMRKWLQEMMDWDTLPENFPPEFNHDAVNEAFKEFTLLKIPAPQAPKTDWFDDWNKEHREPEDIFNTSNHKGQIRIQHGDEPRMEVGGINVLDLKGVDLDNLENIKKLMPSHLNPQSMTSEQVQQFLRDNPIMKELIKALKDIQKSQQ